MMANTLYEVYRDPDFDALYSHRGQPVTSPLQLALATILQYVEGLTDRQTADAVRSRIDWKYLLGLELTDIGFHHSMLSEFRTRLVTVQAERLIFERLLTLCKEKGWLKSGTRQRTDSTHVLASIRAVTRLECVGETMRAAIEFASSCCTRMVATQSQPIGLSVTVSDSKIITYQRR